MTQRTQAIAGMYILLVLSLHPVQAYRTATSQTAFEQFGESQSLVRELHRALHEDTQSEEADDEYIGELFASCAQRKKDFERRAGKTQDRYDEAMADGKMDTTEAAWVILKARVMVKTLKTAEGKGCDWVKKENADQIDKTNMQSLLENVAGGNPCYPVAKARLDAAAEGTAEEQGEAVKASMSILLSEDCSEEVPTSHEEETSDADTLSEEVDEGADELAEAAHDAEKSGKFALLQTLKGDSLLEAEGFDPKDIHELLANEPAEQSADSVLLETVSKVLTGNPLAEALGKVLGFILLVILWALFCWVILAIFMVILGLIMCLLKIIIVAFIRLFGSQAWDFEYGKCMKFWVGALGHSGSGDSIGIALCAASMMSGHR